jgi:uncharacterized protein (DUF305 family)
MVSRSLIGALLVLGALTACGGAARSPMRASGPVPGRALSPAAQAAADSGRQPYSEADVHFVSGMIGHHAQAIQMSGWCPSHGAGASLQVLCERIVVAQRDEIAIMQNWLRDRRLPVPEADPRGMAMPGMPDHIMLMPGMLNAEQMAHLDRARGPAFDRLFLLMMIQHHQGAIQMVDQLHGATSSAQDDLIYKISSDVYADQTTEIERMTRMLAALPSGGR